MAVSCFNPIRTHNFCSFPSIPIPNPKPTSSSSIPKPIHTQQLSLSVLYNNHHRRLTTAARGCGKGGPATELERELEGICGEDEEGVVGIGGRWEEKCRGDGVVEMLECLEREAIMGEDEGREPTDYNRRAQIFDKSSRVFQVLKEKQHNS